MLDLNFKILFILVQNFLEGPLREEIFRWCVLEKEEKKLAIVYI